MKEDFLFEWDPKKDLANREKHRISFEEAERAWDDPGLTQIPLGSFPEERWLAVGKTGKNDYLSAIITYRGQAIRIISARRATTKEKNTYEDHQQ